MTPITASLLASLSTKEKASLMAPLADAINEFFPMFQITTEKRVEHCLAQLLHESDGFRTLEEYASGDAYDTRTDLGNTAAKDGDGRKYKGRGPIQTTGKRNYLRAQEAMAKMGIVVDLINHPELLATPRYGILASCIYWGDNNLNKYADADDAKTITRKINGGLNGYADRLVYLGRCRQAIRG